MIDRQKYFSFFLLCCCGNQSAITGKQKKIFVLSLRKKSCTCIYFTKRKKSFSLSFTIILRYRLVTSSYVIWSVFQVAHSDIRDNKFMLIELAVKTASLMCVRYMRVYVSFLLHMCERKWKEVFVFSYSTTKIGQIIPDSEYICMFS